MHSFSATSPGARVEHYTGCPPECSAVFGETGLPDTPSWTVTLNGTTNTSVNSTVTFQHLVNGTYSYTVGPPSGYTANPYSGTVTIRGQNVTQNITFTASPSFLGLPPTEGYAVFGVVIGILIIVTVVLVLRHRRRTAAAPPPATPPTP
jgi:hypothetical protein